ncbi:MAG TPA: glycosyltransferase family 2 protein [Anaerolineae bacterium]
MSSFPSVSVIVLNYNSMAHLSDNLASLHQLDYPADRLEIVLADNASSDGSTEWVAANYPAVRIVENNANLGFAAGNNAGARAAGGEWIAILNPDTRVQPDWLAELVQPALADPDVVCVASRMLSWDGVTIDFADAAMNFMGWGCQPGYSSRRLDDFSTDKEILFAVGGAMLIKRQVFLDAGGFDPDFFAYYEDVDLGWRLWLMGHKVALATRAVVYHRHHGSWGDVADAQKWLLAERNTLFTVIKNYADDTLARVLPATLLLALQRAYLDVRPDPGVFDGKPAAPISRVFGPRYYLSQAQTLVRQGSYRQLTRRVWDEVERRRRHLRQARPQTVRGRPLQQPIDGYFSVPPVALSRLLAGRDVLQALPLLEEKRKTIQGRRRRTDWQIFPLFQWALRSNFADEQFIQAMNQVIGKFGLVDLFGDVGSPERLEPQAQALSWEISLTLLRLMDRAFVLSEAPEAALRLGGSVPAAAFAVPVESVAVLAGVNQILWSLPDEPLLELLCWLKGRIEGDD